MLTTRLFTRFAKLPVIMLITTAALIVAASFTITRTAFACPAAPPQPLRTLYTESARIVIARPGESSIVQVQVENTYKLFLVCTPLNVSQTLKGEGEEQIVHVFHWVWGEDTDISGIYKEGDNLLVFLKRSEEGSGYEVDNQEYGVKKLSDDELKIYVKRIEELAEIMRQEKPDKAQLLEWLVRCAEEPATRWDGVFELSVSNDAMLASSEKKSSADNASPDAAAAEDNNSGEPSTEISFGGDFRVDPEFARLLTAEQKNRLATLLFSAQSLSYNEYLLIRLVKNWNDARFVPFILSNLRQPTGDTTYFIEEMMGFVAEALHNEAVTDLAAKYREAEDDTQSAGDNVNNADGESASSDDSLEKFEAAPAAPKRSEVLQSFIALVESSLIG